MPSKDALRESNKDLLDQNARLTMRVTMLELVCESLGLHPQALSDPDRLAAIANQQHERKASAVHPDCMIEGGGQRARSG